MITTPSSANRDSELEAEHSPDRDASSSSQELPSFILNEDDIGEKELQPHSMEIVHTINIMHEGNANLETAG
ncbi:hypothetical protein ACJ72_00539 [Emergomyces africanus]|uniref:Uncharacterized protein n=1 Tax=Emergomyces africanus TaxID=1955775 RepID=A0A1B7P7S9_9EURO|nr:hypothetical protein ACJ72_00539 [Emergomyces africanus]